MPSAPFAFSRSTISRNAIIVLIGFLGKISAAGPSIVSLSTTSAGSGESVILPIKFDPQQDTISGIQFDLEWENQAFSLMAVANDAARNSGKSVYQKDLSPGKRRFLVIGFNRDGVKKGILAELIANLKSAEPKTYKIAITNVTATGQDGKSADAAGTGGEITVHNAGTGAKLKAEGVRHGGSLSSGPLAPGEVFVLFGSGIGPDAEHVSEEGPTGLSLGDTAVTFDGIPAPLLYAASNQINGIVPFNVSGKESVQLQIIRNSQKLAELPIALAPAAPSVFTLAADGVGPGAILNQDSTVNMVDNPAERGSIVSLFTTGLGQMNPPGRDGQPAGDDLQRAELPVAVQIGGVDAPVLYAGSAPTLVTGVFQVNCLVPVSLRPGPSIPVFISAGTAMSPSGVTISLK